MFDALNRETDRTDPFNKTATFAYDAASRLSSTTDRLGRRRDFTYDDAGRMTNEVWDASNGSTVENRLTFTYRSFAATKRGKGKSLARGG